jgi:peptidoglycan/LPS O-acetylase OafA/YrhL
VCRPFLSVRRLFRIAPLAAPIYLTVQGKGLDFLPAHLFFYANYDHGHPMDLASHYWSLCVEVQFYLATALLVGVLGLVTHLRVNEILSGAAPALVWLGVAGGPGRAAGRVVRAFPLPLWAAASAASRHPAGGPLRCARPHQATAPVGYTLWRAGPLNGPLQARHQRYIAEIPILST